MSGTDHPVPEARRERPPGLWRHRDFLLLWSGQAVSELGSAVTLLAVPLIAVVLLHASTFSVGLLATASTLPFLIIALPAGLVVDRLAKRPMLIACDASRLVVIGSVPVAAAAGVLTMAQLFVVALVAGVLTVFFDVAYQSYLPALIRADQLADGNGKLSVTQSFAQVAGPGLGGALFGLLRAGALTVDAISYGVSTLSLLLIRTREPAIERPAGDGGERPKLRTEIFAGLNFVVRHPVLRKIAACTGTANFFNSIVFALEIIFLVRVLHVRPAYTGLIVAAGSIGGIVAGLASGALARWIGSARIIWVSMLGFGSLGLLLPLAEPGWRLSLYAVGLLGFSFSAVLYNVAQVSYRQAICPPELLGRMNAAIRWIVWGTLPLGSLAGGALGTLIGVRPALWVGVAGSWAAGFWVLFSPLRRMRDVPTGPEPSEPVAGEPALGEPVLSGPVLGEPVLGEPLPGGIMLDQATAEPARGENR
jgi:MFS family permease